MVLGGQWKVKGGSGHQEVVEGGKVARQGFQAGIQQ